MEWADLLVGGHFVGYHGGEVMDFCAELLIVLAEFGELGIDGV